MQAAPISDFIFKVYNEAKVWLWIGGVMWAVMNAANKGLGYVKSIKENDLHHIQLTLNEVKDCNTAVKTSIDELKDANIEALREQTRAFSEVVKDLKDDLRSLVIVRNPDVRSRFGD